MDRCSVWDHFLNFYIIKLLNKYMWVKRKFNFFFVPTVIFKKKKLLHPLGHFNFIDHDTRKSSLVNHHPRGGKKTFFLNFLHGDRREADDNRAGLFFPLSCPFGWGFNYFFYYFNFFIHRYFHCFFSFGFNLLADLLLLFLFCFTCLLLFYLCFCLFLFYVLVCFCFVLSNY